MNIVALRSRCMDLYNTGAARATLPNDRSNSDGDIVLYSSDDDYEYCRQYNL